MSRLLYALPLFALIAGGCDDQNGQSSAYTQTPVKARPVVTIVPMIDSTNNALSWNLSDEMTTALYHRMSRQDQFYLVDLNQAKVKTRKLHDSQNPFGSDISWVKKAFAGDEFVVFMELIEHHEMLRQDRARTMDPKTCAADLNLGMRVRVFDTRGKEVKVVLQEIIHNSHFVPRQYTHVNFTQAKWGDEGFSISPVGLAHNDFIKDIAERLEDYILLSAKS